MNISQLVIEVTRKCNIRCEHCLRGNPQRKEIANETIDKLLKGVTYISTVTFTGGEPSLNVPAIRHFTKVIKAKGIELGGFYLITNGKVASLELVHALLDLYAAVSPWDRNECCSLMISNDQWHDAQCSTKEARELYEGLAFFRPEHKSNYMVISEGRASKWGSRPVPLGSIIVGLDDDGNVECIEEDVYVNVLGDVVPSCDLSYQSQEKYKIGNVHTETLAEIYKRQAPQDEPDDLIVNHNDELGEALERKVA